MNLQPILSVRFGDMRGIVIEEGEQGSCTTLMRTSPFCGGSTVTVLTSRGFLASQAMAALHCIGCMQRQSQYRA